jgi:phenylpropionate dioxygenase-like ring-hydroxylating dioxygenase large terminal subunit
VSLEPYRSEAFFELERRNVFRRAWLLIGRVDILPKAGDYMVRDFEVVNASVIVTRSHDGLVRAFYNACPHRANQVVTDKAGSSSVFMCRYHNWTFSNDGRLRGVPDEKLFLGLKKSSCGLNSIPIEFWDGWIFINFAPQPEVSLPEFLGGMTEFLGGLENINSPTPVVIETHLKCNWKVVSDAFLEAYHIQAIHSTTLKTMFSKSQNQYGRLLDARVFPPHSANSMYGNPEHVPADDQKIERFAYDPSTLSGEHIADLQRFGGHRAVNPTRSPSWSMDVVNVFPNTQIDMGPTGYWIHQFWPISVSETRHEARFFLRPPASIRDRFAQEYQIAHAVDIVLEDLGNVERTQLGINSRGTETMQLSETEILIRANLHHVNVWANAPTVAEALRTGRQ